MPATLADLVTTKTKDDEVQSLLSVLQSLGFPVTDWRPGAVARTMAEAIGQALSDMSKLVSTVASGAYPRLAAALADPVWLDLLLEQFYDLTRTRATHTKQMVRVTSTAGTGSQVINPGFMVMNPTNGNRYVYEGSPVTVLDGNFADIEMKAESAGAKYADGTGTLTQVVTELTGISANNLPQAFGGTIGLIATKNAANKGSGTVTPSHASIPALQRFYKITVLASGAAGASGTVQIEWEEDTVKTVNVVTPIPLSYIGAGDGVTMIFANGSGAGFIKGDIHTFQTPGSAITANGVDDESNASYLARALGRWPSLSNNIVDDKYVLWVRQASLEGAYGIEKITISPSNAIAGQTDILVATATGAPSGAAIAAIQSYLNARDGMTDTANVFAASNESINITGTVIVRATEIEAVKAAADAAWTKYIGDLPINGDVSTGTPGVVRLSELVQAVMDAGAIDYTDLRINGNAANFALDPGEVAVIPTGQLPSVALTWSAVG